MITTPLHPSPDIGLGASFRNGGCVCGEQWRLVGEREREKRACICIFFPPSYAENLPPPTHVESEIKYDFMFVRYYDISP